MSLDLFQDFPPQLSSEQRDYLVQAVKNWSTEHGLCVRPSSSFVSDEINPNHNLATNAPVTLFPSPFPKSCFDQAQALQSVYNKLYAAIADDEDWLGEVMKELIEVDDFLSNLWKIHLQVKEEGYTHKHSLGMFRSDYMLHAPTDSEPPSLKQVEFNTISSSFGGLASLVTQLHTHLASFPTPATSLAYPAHPLFQPNTTSEPSISTSGIPPPNNAVPTLTSSLAASHKAYGASKSTPTLPLCILFLVQDNERNIFDQLALSSHLHTHHKIPSFRLGTSQILTLTTIPSTEDNPHRPLIYTPPSTPTVLYEVTTVYFRALYAPTEYDSPTSWAARHHLERSAATKCPTVLLHLAGSKKIQQVLTDHHPDHLSRFLPNHTPETLSQLRTTFAPQYSLSVTDTNDGPSSTTTKKANGLEIALDPTKSQTHVLKPQREGGGNNIYRANIPPYLRSIPERDYKRYVLMELIRPPAAARNTVLRSDGEVVTGNVISELGIFGTCLWQKKNKDKNGKGERAIDILLNEQGGYLLRTKAKDSDEGGVAAGFSSLDSLVLYEHDKSVSTRP